MFSGYGQLKSYLYPKYYLQSNSWVKGFFSLCLPPTPHFCIPGNASTGLILQLISHMVFFQSVEKKPLQTSQLFGLWKAQQVQIIVIQAEIRLSCSPTPMLFPGLLKLDQKAENFVACTVVQNVHFFQQDSVSCCFLLMSFTLFYQIIIFFFRWKLT